jgi:hypothetical protein
LSVKLLLCFVAATVVLLSQISTVGTAVAPPSGTFSGYLLAMFAMEGSDPVLQEHTTTDLVTFTPTANTIAYNCRYNVRDPSIIKYAGTYYLAHTVAGSGSCAPDAHHIALSSSADGFSWSNAVLMDYSDVTTQCAWAPEWFVDPNGTGVSALHLYVSAGDCVSSFTLYEKHATASDFISNTASWSSNVSLPISGQTASIDPFMVYMSGGCPSGTGNYCLWFKNNSNNCVQYAASTSAAGTFAPVKTGNWAGWGCSYEAPALIKNTGGTWYAYLDNGAGQLTAGQLYYTTSTDNWVTWSTPAAISTVGQAKHGTVIAYP